MATSAYPNRTHADLAYDAAFAGPIGGGVVAMFILLMDTIAGQPLATPSLMGAMLLGGSGADGTVQMHFVAYATMAHLVGFAVLGAIAAAVLHRAEKTSRNPGWQLVGLFLATMIGFFIGASAFMPGFISQVGALQIVAANVFAAIAMTIFFDRSRNAALSTRVRYALRWG